MFPQYLTKRLFEHGPPHIWHFTNRPLRSRAHQPPKTRAPHRHQRLGELRRRQVVRERARIELRARQIEEGRSLAIDNKRNSRELRRTNVLARRMYLADIGPLEPITWRAQWIAQGDPRRRKRQSLEPPPWRALDTPILGACQALNQSLRLDFSADCPAYV